MLHSRAVQQSDEPDEAGVSDGASQVIRVLCASPVATDGYHQRSSNAFQRFGANEIIFIFLSGLYDPGSRLCSPKP